MHSTRGAGTVYVHCHCGWWLQHSEDPWDQRLKGTSGWGAGVYRSRVTCLRCLSTEEEKS